MLAQDADGKAARARCGHPAAAYHIQPACWPLVDELMEPVLVQKYPQYYLTRDTFMAKVILVSM
jgi:hypothetical protein